MTKARTIGLTAVAMAAFAANSVLCRLALAPGSIDPMSFTLVRIGAGALVLWFLARGRGVVVGGSWPGALALIAYAAAFSLAYVSLSAGAGALLLFGAVQATMILVGFLRGEKLALVQWIGLLLALTGLAVLLAPGATAPPPLGAALMLAAGVAWGGYSLLGRGAALDPLGATAGNFMRALPIACALSIAAAAFFHASAAGLVYAALSGGVASGLGYTIWYAALPGLSAAQAASVQLSVPVITALGSAIVLGEALTLRLVAASVAVLGGIALVIAQRARVART